MSTNSTGNSDNPVSIPKINGKAQGQQTLCQRYIPRILKFFGIVLLYSVLYGVLGLIVVLMHYFTYNNIMRHDAGASIIESRPGLRFFPLPPGTNYKSFTIWYNRSTPDHTALYTQVLLDIINKEFKKQKNLEYIHCEHNVSYQDGEILRKLNEQRKFCKVYDHEYLDWGRCTPFGDGRPIRDLSGPFKFESGMDPFGYTKGNPCVMLRLNRINLWKPSKTWLTLKKWDEYEDVGVRISADWEKNVENFPDGHKNVSLDYYVWILCDGLTPEDRELMGQVEYFPRERPGLPKIYFPFRGQAEYLAPFIFIQFLNPTPQVVLRIRCTAFDNNLDLEQHLISAVGTINFELLID